MNVSIVTPVHNSERYLDECVDSVMAQTATDWEQILVDDASTDATQEIGLAIAASDKRVRYVRQDRNGGAATARNAAIRLAKGRYIAFLDADDLWYPSKLERQLDFMQSSGAPFTFTSYERFTTDRSKPEQRVEAPPRVTYQSALYKNRIGCSTVIYDTDFFGKQYMPELRKRQDFALWLRLLKLSEGRGLQEVLVSYRAHSDSLSAPKVGLVGHEWRVYRDVEGLSVPKSAFYTTSVVINKVTSFL